MGEIVSVVIQAYREGRDINLSKIKCDICSRYRLQNQPKIVEIINAIPDQYRKVLLPLLKAKPIRTASGVCNSFFFFVIEYY